MVVAKNIVTASALRDVSLYFGSPEYVADQVFPLININNPTAKLTKYLESDFFRNDARVRGEGAEAVRGKFKTTELTYSCIEYAYSSPVTDELRRNSRKLNAQPLSPDIDAIELCKRKIMMNREGMVADLIKAGTWADAVSGGEDVDGKWASSESSNTFIADVKKAIQTLRGRGIVGGGNLEIRLLLDDLTFDEVTEISRVREQFKYTNAESISPEMLARMLKIDKVIVPSAVHNTAKETKAGTEFTASRFWKGTASATSGMAFLYAYPKSVGPRMLCAGIQVRDKFDESEGGGYERFMKWRESSEHQDVYEVAENRDQLQVCATAGYLFKDTIST